MIQSEHIKRINLLLTKHGLKKAWASILLTRIENYGKKFEYILKDNAFRGANRLENDILHNLTIGEISVLYEYSLAHTDRNSRKEEGQYFTPDDVAQLMSKKSSLFPDGIWIDPCSGVGNLAYWLIHRQKDPETFLLKNMYLLDKDETALFIARTLLTLEFQNKRKDLFFSIKDRFILADFLKSTKLPKYDYAILNPPYVSTEKDITFASYKAQNTYAYFLERVIESTKGFISITPQSFTHAPGYKKIRQLLIDNYNKLFIYCFDNVPANIFKGIKFGSKNTNKVNSTRASIIIALKEGIKISHFITPLLRWRSTERAKLFANIDSFLTKIDLSEKIFPKVEKGLVALYKSVIKFPEKLEDILEVKKTNYSLQVPSTPRYFISAIKKPVKRTSFRTIYLKDKDDLDFVYMLLNSSYMYWWWRVNDGGMTISENTLLSLPLPKKIDIENQTIKNLEKSEVTNKVFKKNAGKMNENVKHSVELVQNLNSLLFPDYSFKLTNVHANSVFKDKEYYNHEEEA